MSVLFRVEADETGMLISCKKQIKKKIVLLIFWQKNHLLVIASLFLMWYLRYWLKRVEVKRSMFTKRCKSSVDATLKLDHLLKKEKD